MILNPDLSCCALTLDIKRGFQFGQTYDRLYNPVGLVQESAASGHPVIYVGINYRVGCMLLHQYMANTSH